jgi:hypothetical protein
LTNWAKNHNLNFSPFPFFGKGAGGWAHFFEAARINFRGRLQASLLPQVPQKRAPKSMGLKHFGQTASVCGSTGAVLITG